jgi:hypothetical protein
MVGCELMLTQLVMVAGEIEDLDKNDANQILFSTTII